MAARDDYPIEIRVERTMFAVPVALLQSIEDQAISPEEAVTCLRLMASAQQCGDFSLKTTASGGHVEKLIKVGWLVRDDNGLLIVNHKPGGGA